MKVKAIWILPALAGARAWTRPPAACALVMECGGGCRALGE